MFIKITGHDNRIAYLNVNHIVSISDTNNLNGGYLIDIFKEEVYIKESAKEILELINKQL